MSTGNLTPGTSLVEPQADPEVFAVPDSGARLAFRGGTALFKLHLRPAARYSEDIDLVQMTPGPIGQTFDALRAVLDPWLGTPRRVAKEGRVNLVYRFESEDEPAKPMRLKIEINSREHFSEHEHGRHPFEVRSRWWSGRADVTTFTLDELLGTKMRELYQRKKGRDLFDLWWALQHGADPERIATCFARYMRESRRRVSRAVRSEPGCQDRGHAVHRRHGAAAPNRSGMGSAQGSSGRVRGTRCEAPWLTGLPSKRPYVIAGVRQ